ncbi:hypothetical protein Glove_130g182 [Diversispora epigaea]|uniref:Uncharacterized protein n=1 Tax=Diversispora epigaea TaxID=1348612 RepID=A0A397J2M3_9GLOM|nr:hypothetical protein Glove_130g182 [Diversispora epigaea]
MAEIAKELSYPKYWERNSASWGSVADWDIYFINEIPGASRVQSHRTLARELETLVNYFDKDSREWKKAKGLKKELKIGIKYAIFFFSSLSMAEIAKELSYPKYWERNSASWGSVADWDIYFINEIPGASRVQSHRTLARELETLVNYFDKDSREWKKAKGLKKELKLKKTNDIVDSTIWVDHHKTIQKAVTESKINENINKRKIENIARDVTCATAKTYYTQSELSSHYRTDAEGVREMSQKKLCSDSISKTNENNIDRNRCCTPPLQISTSVNQNLLDQLDKEKENAKLNIEPICSNIIDTTNKNLMARLQLERDYCIEPNFNATTKYIDELIDKSHNRNDLRQKLLDPFLSPGETYSFEKHYEISWARRFADKLLMFFEAPRNPLLDRNSEGWINCHLLTPLIDDCFLTCEAIQIHRCEEMSLASITRKNLSREESNKKQPGHKIDIIFRVDDIEYFGAETFVDDDFHNSKPINYKRKLFREMKDQLDRLLKKLKFTKETIILANQIVLHGISHGGYNGKVYAMYYDINLRYYFVFEMCQYRIGTTWNSVPESLNILKDILHLKKGIIHTLDIVTRIKKLALQTRSKELFSIDNLPETTRSPQKR